MHKTEKEGGGQSWDGWRLGDDMMCQEEHTPPSRYHIYCPLSLFRFIFGEIQSLLVQNSIQISFFFPEKLSVAKSEFFSQTSRPP